ncbi:GNAT family N-acetyltransferase [Streptomyces sp. NPDC057939]|uniref:GNAT family N-acetyltransferase n=1 Tax=Streptomyces sp. NPDC057939 TaxID=3346284 RepID=UPI0036EB02D1
MKSVLRAASLSYVLRDDTWGRGYATEAARYAVGQAFTAAGLSRLEAMHHPQNPASGRVLTKNGFTPIGTLDQRDHDGQIRPYPAYALQAADS